MFGMEALLESGMCTRENKDGIFLIASANSAGRKIFCQLIDLVLSLVNEWYPGLAKGKHDSNGLEQRVPCFKCIKEGRDKPYEFEVKQLVPANDFH